MRNDPLSHPDLNYLCVVIQYTNWKGEVRDRLIRPLENHYHFKSTQHHPEEQWVVHAYDLDKQDYRIFTMKDISSWRPATEEDFKARSE